MAWHGDDGDDIDAFVFHIALGFKKIEWKSALAFQYEAEYIFYMGLDIKELNNIYSTQD